MAEKRNYMPQSTAGLLRYTDEDGAGIKIKPIHVIVVGIAFGLAVVVLHFII